MAISYTHGGHVFSLRVLSPSLPLCLYNTQSLVSDTVQAGSAPAGCTLHPVSSHSEGLCPFICSRYILTSFVVLWRQIQRLIWPGKSGFKCVLITCKCVWFEALRSDQHVVCHTANYISSPHCACLCLSLMPPCCCDTNQDSALGLWPVHSSTSLWFWAGVLDTLFSPFLVIFPSLNLWHDCVWESLYRLKNSQVMHARVVRRNLF